MLLPLNFFTIIVLLATTSPVGVAHQLYEWQQDYHGSSINGQATKRIVEKRQIIEGDSCLATLYIIAFTSDRQNAASDGYQMIQLQYNGSIVRNLTLYDRPGNDFLTNKGDLWIYNLSFYGCITLSGIKRVSVVANSTDGWNIESIVTLVSESTLNSSQVQVLTQDIRIFRWIDRDSILESERHFDLRLSTTDIISKGSCLSMLYVIAFTSIQSTAGSDTPRREVQIQYNGTVQSLNLYDRFGAIDYQSGKGDMWKFSLAKYGCIIISSIQRVSVVQKGNGTWNIELIVTLVENSSNIIQLLTRDFNVYRWINSTSDGNSSQGQFDLTFADINECESDPCHSNATCENTAGSFTCQCDAGYEGDGFTCQEVQPDIKLDIGIISGTVTVGVVILSCLVVIGIVIIYLRYYTRMSFDVKRNDLVARSPDYPRKCFESHPDTVPGTISVQSSYTLNLPPYLLVHAADIKLGESIGQGEFGIVYKGYIVKDQGSIVTDTVAIKTLKGLYDRSTVKDMLKECAKMYNFDHSHVLTLKGICLDGGAAPYIIMPFMANGSLLAYLKKNRKTLVVSWNDKDEDDVMATQKRLMDMCIQVAKGMEYLASMKMVHRDLAARNCMIDMNFIIKVADFGLAESIGTREYFRQDKSSHIKLPLRWLAPESMDDYVFSEMSDVWAYGVTCWEIFSGGKVPYGGVGVTNLSQLLANEYRLDKPNNDACSDELYKFILQCWEFEPMNRPRFANIVSALSISLEAMAGYLDIGAFGGTTAETRKCGETLELVEEQVLCQASGEEKYQDDIPIPDESTL